MLNAVNVIFFPQSSTMVSSTAPASASGATNQSCSAEENPETMSETPTAEASVAKPVSRSTVCHGKADFISGLFLGLSNALPILGQILSLTV